MIFPTLLYSGDISDKDPCVVLIFVTGKGLKLNSWYKLSICTQSKTQTMIKDIYLSLHVQYDSKEPLSSTQR